MIILLLVIIAAILISAAFLLFVGPRMLLTPDRREPGYYQEKFGFSHPSQIGLTYEDRILKTDDGYRLSYWAINSPDCRETHGAVVYLHGITDSKVSGLNYARYLAKSCRKIYLIDMRRHGESEGEFCTYGYHEKHDVVRLIDEIERENPGQGVVLLGNSMGAAIAIQVAAIDQRVSRVIAIAPFYDLFTIALDHELRRFKMRNKTLLRFVLLRAQRLARFKAEDVSPARDIAKVKVPVLIVHGENDRTIKKEYSVRLSELGKNTRLLTIPGAGHVDVLEKGGPAFLNELESFLGSP